MEYGSSSGIWLVWVNYINNVLKKSELSKKNDIRFCYLKMDC